MPRLNSTIRWRTVRTKLKKSTLFVYIHVLYYIIEFRLRFCHTLTVLINVSAFAELYNTVLNFRHFFLRSSPPWEKRHTGGIQHVESDLDDFCNKKPPNFVVFFSPIAIWGLCYFMWIDFLFGYLATNVRILLTCFDVAQTCSYMFVLWVLFDE